GVEGEEPGVEDETPADEPAPVEISAVVLPQGTESKVEFVPVSEQPAPAGKETSTKKVFEINVPTYEKGEASTVKFQMTVKELEADGKTAADVALWHFDEETGEWTKLVTSYTIVDGIVYFEAITYDFSPFAIIYEDEPAEEPSEEPAESPAPVLGVLAALGAAVVLRRK
ncbi:MAG: PGF-pre-PGF domain-containing protein, partial [Methanocorpusculum sp.]|nr:PGF-pre-PGF domain-containing protein [Methanocorpusculum sp.]